MRLNFRVFREISSQFSDTTMKIRVKVVCSFLTLSKKPPLFLNPGYAPEIVHERTLRPKPRVLNRGPLALIEGQGTLTRGTRAHDSLMVRGLLTLLSVFRLAENWLPISSACSNVAVFVCDITKRIEDFLHTCSPVISTGVPQNPEVNAICDFFQITELLVRGFRDVRRKIVDDCGFRRDAVFL